IYNARFVCYYEYFFFFFFQAEDGIRDATVTGVQTCALPITLEFEAVGGSLKLILNGELVASAINGSLKSGSVGMRLTKGTVVASFQAAAVTKLNATLPFSDNFSTTSDGSQLSRNWSDRLGNITVVNGLAT